MVTVRVFKLGTSSFVNSARDQYKFYLFNCVKLVICILHFECDCSLVRKIAIMSILYRSCDSIYFINTHMYIDFLNLKINTKN